MPVQMRLSPNDNRLYSPDRDLAYCTPHLVHRALLGLDPENHEPWVKAFLEKESVTNEQLCEAGMVMARYLNIMSIDPQYKQPVEALEAAGFFLLPGAVQTLVCAKMGQAFLSAAFLSVRDVMKTPNDPPFDKAMINKAVADLILKIQFPDKPTTWFQKLRDWWSK